MDVATFDAWRENYLHMTYREQQEFYDRVEVEHPHQAAFAAAHFGRFFEHIQEVLEVAYVLEVGGWKGELACKMLAAASLPGISVWCNVEICQRAVDRGVCDSSRYTTFVPRSFPWNVELPPANIFAASHFIEHITRNDLDMLIQNLPDTVRYIGLEAPIPDGGNDIDWTGYHGSHILEIGWRSAERLLMNNGFLPISQLSIDDFRAFYR
ncbi:MAG: hypothetical protein V3W44_01990 [Dehalococcoidales bacterium]